MTRNQSADKQKALDSALAQIERNFGKGSIMKLGQQTTMDIEAELDDVNEQLDKMSDLLIQGAEPKLLEKLKEQQRELEAEKEKLKADLKAKEQKLKELYQKREKAALEASQGDELLLLFFFQE